MASDLTRQVSLASCTYCKYAFSAKSDDSILKTTTLITIHTHTIEVEAEDRHNREAHHGM